AEMTDHIYKILELVGSAEKRHRRCHSECHLPRIKDHPRDEMVRSRANERPCRKWVRSPLPSHLAGWIYTRGVTSGSHQRSMEQSSDLGYWPFASVRAVQRRSGAGGRPAVT